MSGRDLTEDLKALLEEKATDQPVYVKSRFLADEVGASPKQIGYVMGQLQTEGVPNLEIEKWAYSSGTTWMVTQG